MKTYERACAHTKTSQISFQRELFGLSVEQLDLQFQGRRCTWRSWAYLKLQCLCARIRISVVKTHSDVNSWPSRSPSCEHPLLPCLHTHFLRNVGLGREMTLQHTWSLESTKNYSSLSTENYSSLYHPSIVKLTGGSNLGCSVSLHFSWVYYESMERKLLKPIYECRCNGRLQTKRFTRLAHTGSVSVVLL
jgi:hypothetical protein